MYHLPLAFLFICGRRHEGDENGDGKEKRELRLSGLLYADDLVLCGNSKNDIWVMLGILLRCVGREF